MKKFALSLAAVFAMALFSSATAKAQETCEIIGVQESVVRCWEQIGGMACVTFYDMITGDQLNGPTSCVSGYLSEEAMRRRSADERSSEQELQTVVAYLPAKGDGTIGSFGSSSSSFRTSRSSIRRDGATTEASAA